MNSYRKSSGFAIISVLLILTILTIMVVAFLQSMRIDRLTARAYLNKAAAESAARAGVADAINRVSDAILEKNFHAIAYHFPPTATADDAPFTTVYGGDFAQIFASSASTAPSYTYLVSSADPSVPPDVSDSNKYIDINTLSSSSEVNGWIGSRVISSGLSAGAHERLMHRAEWIEVLSDPTLPEQPDQNQANHNPVVSRFAYWIEDESSKVNFRISGNSAGPSGIFERSDESNTISDIDIGALPIREVSGSWFPLQLNATAGSINQSIISMFQPGNAISQILDPRIINRNTILNPNASNGTDIYEAIKFHATAFSESLNVNSLSRRKINLNQLVDNRESADTDASWANKIRADLDDLIYAITGSHGFTGVQSNHNAIFANESNLSANDVLSPEFGKRFYQNTTSNHEEIYLKRIAANIRDYIDTDIYPTYLDVNGNVITGAVANVGWLPGSEPLAIGKEAIPYLQEHMWRGREVSWSPAGTNTFSYTVEMDHYFELFNPSNKNFVAPAGTTLKVYSQPRWLAGSQEDLEPDDILMDLSGVVFPAGQAIVVTTDPNPPSLGSGNGNIISVPVTTDNAWTSMSAGDGRTYSGFTNEPIGSDWGLQLSGRSSSITDYVTEMIMGSPDGFFHSFGFLSISLGFSNQWNFKGNDQGSSSRFFYSSSMRGNDQIDRSGDPRSLNEQLLLLPYSSGGPSHQSRFYGGVQGILDNSRHSLGRAGIGFVNTTIWPDYTPALSDNNSTSYAVIADAPLQSIGELGHIYDPHRRASNPSIIPYARGGGRSLKIGQKDDVANTATRFTTDWRNAAWQLCDTFDAENFSTNTQASSIRSGLININGVLRDRGTAMRAVLRDMEFLPPPNSDPSIAGQNLSDAELNSIINSIESYLTNQGPIMHPGELSEISYFNPNDSSNPQFAGRNTDVVNDRGREEIFRRLVQLTGTRSTTFSVYVVGDAIKQTDNGTKIRLARQRYKVIFRLTPQFDTGPNGKINNFTREILYETF